jgi:hypothetical protein
LLVIHQIPPVILCNQSITNSHSLNNCGTYANYRTHLTHIPSRQFQTTGDFQPVLPPSCSLDAGTIEYLVGNRRIITIFVSSMAILTLFVRWRLSHCAAVHSQYAAK